MRLEGSEAGMLSWWRPVGLAPPGLWSTACTTELGPPFSRGAGVFHCVRPSRRLWGVGPGLASGGGSSPWPRGSQLPAAHPHCRREGHASPEHGLQRARGVSYTRESPSVGERDLFARETFQRGHKNNTCVLD